MKITWVTRSFLDYRIPVYKAMNDLCGNQLTVIYNAEVVPQRCQDKINDVLGNRAIGLKGELRIGGQKVNNQTFANKGGIRIPFQPGLIKIIRSSNPDLILSDGFFQWTYAAIAMKILSRNPHIMLYERTPHTERAVSKLRILGRKIASMFIDRIGGNGIETYTYLKNFGFPEDRLFIGNMAADVQGLQQMVASIPHSELVAFKKNKKINGPIYLYVGQLIPRKGIRRMVDAWKEFIEVVKEPTLVLIGGGEQESKIREKIQKEKISNIHLLGRVDYSEVAKYYAVADVFIISTLEDNWSLVVPEAMSCGLPIACSQYNGCWPELVKPENGWVFDPLNEKSFSDTLAQIWEERDKWQEMGLASQELVKAFSPIKTANVIYNHCLDVVQKSKNSK